MNINHLTKSIPIFIIYCVVRIISTEMAGVPQQILESMCESFEIPYDERVINRYKTSTISYAPFKELHLLVKNTDWCIYIDKLWVTNKGHGIGTRYFREYLLQTTMPLVWRTRTERRRDWYMRFEGVRTVAKYNGFYFLVCDAGTRHNWTFEDLCLFNEPSLTAT